MAAFTCRKIKMKTFTKENRDLKTSELIIAIKHVLNIECGPQPLQRLNKTFVEHLNLCFKYKIQC